MNKINIDDVLEILKQIGGPVKITYQTKQVTRISIELINYHIQRLNYIKESKNDLSEVYNISDFYSLYGCINYILNDLGEDEFETVTGKDLYSHGYKLLNNIKNIIVS